jgi:hypothetical protein
MPVLGSKNLFRILEIGTGWMALDALGAGTRQLSALVVAAGWRLLVSSGYSVGKGGSEAKIRGHGGRTFGYGATAIPVTIIRSKPAEPGRAGAGGSF